MKFIETYVSIADPDWDALDKFKEHALEPSTDDDVEMGEPHDEEEAEMAETREKSKGALKRAPPTPERSGKESKKHEKPTAWQKGAGKAKHDVQPQLIDDDAWSDPRSCDS